MTGLRSYAVCRIDVEAITGSDSQRPVSRNTACIAPQTRPNASKNAGVQARSPGIARPPMITWCATFRSDWERIHALIDPACAGLPRLIREYNQSFPGESRARLEDPDHALAIPCFNP